MNHRYTVLINSLTKKFPRLNLYPPLAWIAILGLIITTAFFLLVGFSSILQILFPILSVTVAIFLYFRYPILYLGFNWWVWFISPFISRMVEYQNGWTNPEFRLIILTPYLTTLVTSISFFRYLPKNSKEDEFPFVLAFLATLYSLLIGLIKNISIFEVLERFLSWTIGIFLGFHLCVNWKDYPKYRRNTKNTFAWSAMVMGVYGIVQYIIPIKWDQFWLKNSENLLNCCGWPDPWNIRVWSTLNYPFTFAYSMQACLIVLLTSKGAFSSGSSLMGFMALLLSRVRGAWMGCLIGVVAFASSLKFRARIRLLIAISCVGLGLYFLSNIDQFSSAVITRLQTLSNVQGDRSLQVRSSIYTALFDEVVSEFIGRGMGSSKIIDAGILDVIATLGWLGCIPYIISVVLVFFSVFKSTKIELDSFVYAARSISLSILTTLPFNNSLMLLPGVLFWGFLGMAVAGRKYSIQFKSQSPQFESRC